MARRPGTFDPRKANGHRRRALFQRVMAEEHVCWICGRPVDPGLRGARVVNPETGRTCMHPMSPSLDELVPVSLGGDPYDRENVRLAHWMCNVRRGNRVPGPRASCGGDAGAGAPTGSPRPSQDWGA